MEILRYAAFSSDPSGGNPAGVVLDARGVSDNEMLEAAADVGYSETAFLTSGGGSTWDIRYFSPLAEVAFCGHATIATAVALAERQGPGELVFQTPVGPVRVQTNVTDGHVQATLTSAEPTVSLLDEADLDEVLAALDWKRSDLDPALPPRIAYAGVWHPIIAVRERSRLAALDYDVERLGRLMSERGWTTVDLVQRESNTLFHARNPFPPGGVVEDPATGAAASAFGGYLRELGQVQPPATITIRQGDDMGRPGVLTVEILTSGGIRVSGTAVPIT